MTRTLNNAETPFPPRHLVLWRRFVGWVHPRRFNGYTGQEKMTTDMDDTFQAKLEDILRRVLDIPDDRFGCPEVEIAAAEERIGHRLPRPLQRFYRYIGGHSMWRVGLHPLVALDRLQIQDSALVFLEECQGVVEHFLPESELANPSPSVFQREPGCTESHREPEPLPLFLLQMLVWQINSVAEDLEQFADACHSMWYGEEMSHERAEDAVAHLIRVVLNGQPEGGSDAAYYGEHEVAYLFVGVYTTTVYGWGLSDEEGEEV